MTVSRCQPQSVAPVYDPTNILGHSEDTGDMRVGIRRRYRGPLSRLEVARAACALDPAGGPDRHDAAGDGQRALVPQVAVHDAHRVQVREPAHNLRRVEPRAPPATLANTPSKT